MEQLIATIEKGQPLFNAIARNKYLKAIRDGFISVIPIIIFSSIFCLVASVPNIWGFYWPDDINNALWKCYNYSMGILAIACAATTAKHFADAQNRDLPKNNQINFISCMCAAIIGFLLLSSDTISTDAASCFNTTYLGSKGLLTAFIAAFVTGIIYKFFIKRNITVKMPEQVPPNISQTFKDIIPFSVCITVFWVFDIVFRSAFGFCFAQGVIQVFQPLFTAADGYIGLAVIYGAMSLFWFVGVHGPSIVEPAIAAALVANMTDNLAAEAQKRDTFGLCITPEGTRSLNPDWKKGFYFIALKAGIPIHLYALDYEKKLIQCTKVIEPSGDVEKDMREIKLYFKDFKGKKPEKFTVGNIE